MADKQLEALRQPGIGRAALGQGADLHRIHGNEGGLDQLLLHLLIEAGVQGVAPGLFGGIRQLHAHGLSRGHGLGVIGDGAEVHAHILLDGVHHGQPAPAGSQVDLLAHPLHLIAAVDLLGSACQNTLGNVHHGVEVSVSLIHLHGGEFWVMLGVHALVAENAADLIHTVHAAHDEPLQRQLRGDAHVHINVQRVVMGDEGPGGGAAARPFITHHNTLDIDMYMRIATELPLKRLIVGGMDRVYEIGRIFRNEGMDPKHNPEFTTVEMYQAYADFHTMMDIAEGILAGAAKEINGSYQVEWMGEQIDLTPGWRRLTMVDAVKEYVGVDFGAITDDAEAVAAAKAVGVELADAAEKTWGNALYACFDQKVEEKLIQPTFITMYPVEVSPLTKRSPADPRLTERFELFICHSELANAYSELNDPIDQRQRFEKQVEQRERGDDETEMLDEDFLTAMEYGMPPTGGMGMGIDRCVMLLTGADTIREVILFPTMKPIEN